MAPPSALMPTATGAFIEVDITADSPTYPSWQRPVRTFFRRTVDGWKLVGLERLPEGVAGAVSPRAGSSE